MTLPTPTYRKHTMVQLVRALGVGAFLAVSTVASTGAAQSCPPDYPQLCGTGCAPAGAECCANGKYCPSGSYCNSSGGCTSNSGSGGSGGGGGGSGTCPSSHPVDCGNGYCCDSSHPYCCSNGTCSSTSSCSGGGGVVAVAVAVTVAAVGPAPPAIRSTAATGIVATRRIPTVAATGPVRAQARATAAAAVVAVMAAVPRPPGATRVRPQMSRMQIAATSSTASPMTRPRVTTRPMVIGSTAPTRRMSPDVPRTRLTTVPARAARRITTRIPVAAVQ